MFNIQKMTHQHNDKLGNIKQTYEKDEFIKKVDQRKDNVYIYVILTWLVLWEIIHDGLCLLKSNFLFQYTFESTLKFDDINETFIITS